MAKNAQLAHSGDLIMKLGEALGFDGSMVRRVVVDVCVQYPVIAYVEMFGSDKLLKIDWAGELQDTEVKIVGKDQS